VKVYEEGPIFNGRGKRRTGGRIKDDFLAVADSNEKPTIQEEGRMFFYQRGSRGTFRRRGINTTSARKAVTSTSACLVRSRTSLRRVKKGEILVK